MDAMPPVHPPVNALATPAPKASVASFAMTSRSSKAAVKALRPSLQANPTRIVIRMPQAEDRRALEDRPPSDRFVRTTCGCHDQLSFLILGNLGLVGFNASRG